MSPQKNLRAPPLTRDSDSEKNCKVGDFGLATSSLAAVDPSDVSPMSVNAFSDFTLDVGTRLYIAPEILSKRGGRDKDHSKADLYSLGVCAGNETLLYFMP